jgi:hypothetical protein
MAYRAEVFHTFDADLNRSDLKGFATAISLFTSTAAKIQADRVEQSVFGRAGGAPEYWGQ